METMAQRVARRMQELDLNQPALAEAIGVKQQTISALLKGKIDKPRFLPELSNILQVSIQWLLTGKEAVPRHKKIIKEDAGTVINDSTKLPFLATHIVPYTSEKIPVYKLIGEKGVEKINHDAPAGWRFKPTMLANIEGLYAIEQHDNSADPRYRIGEHLYLSPRHPLPGEDCVIQLKKGGVMLRQFISQDGKEAKYFQYNPAKNGKVSLAEINFIHSVERP